MIPIRNIWKRLRTAFSSTIPDLISNFFTTKNATNRKRWNIIKLLFNLKILKRDIITCYPPTIFICSGNICNLNCVLCPAGKKQPGREPGFLLGAVVEKVIKDIGPYLYSVNLYNWGEPFLNKNIFEYIRLFKKANISVSISSNFNIFNEKIKKEIVNSGLDELIISLDGCSQESIDKYQVGNNFEKVISNVRELADYKNEIGVNHPVIIWRFVVNRFNENEILKASKLHKEVGFNCLELNAIMCDMGYVLFCDNKKQFSNIEPYLPKNEKLSLYDYKKQEKKLLKTYCNRLWLETIINWNGSVSPCCAVWEEKYDFGNILEKPFKEIWNGTKYKLARRINRITQRKIYPELICSICINNKAVL